MAKLTIGEALQKSTAYFEEKGCESPRLSAELLLAHVMQTDRLHLYTNYDQPIGERETAEYREFVRRRGLGEPVAYLLGKKEFYSFEFDVGPEVLIPRPETELLVESTLEILNKCAASNVRILEVGTGSGIVAITLALSCEKADIVATDISADALEWAGRNAEKHGVAERVKFFQADLATPVDGEGQSEIRKGFDVIVSNPPYVPTGDLNGLQMEIRDWEPREALDGGEDGLDVVRRILSETTDALKEDGYFLFEVGEGQASKLVDEFGDTWNAEIRSDLGGCERVVILTRGRSKE